MATTPVRFEFDCQNSKLTFTHALPSALVVPPLQQGSNYMEDFVSAISPILEEHQPQCRSASASTCQACSEPAIKVLQTPMSWLHNTQDPFINVWVNPVCGKEECELKTRQSIQDMMRFISEDAGNETQEEEGEENMLHAEVTICKVCRTTEGVARCARCRAVAYCGKEHQRQDWPSHKKTCAALES